MIAVGGPARHLQHFAHGGTLGNQTLKIVAALSGLHRVVNPHAQREHLGSALDGVNHVSDVEGLDQVVIGAQLHGFDGAIHHVVGAHHDHDGRGRDFFCLPQNFDSVNARQNDIEQRKCRACPQPPS